REGDRMGVMHTRPSGESTYRRNRLIAVLVSMFFVAVSTAAPSASQAKQRAQSSPSTQLKSVAKRVAVVPKAQVKAAPRVTKVVVQQPAKSNHASAPAK